mmetsp:Transcript_19890/g.32620  ORF Transcript_19890/g.32620 Transcript_19890/m.32620 type:complete len:158 (-) Transcript_19890:440-913(-)
MGATNRPDLLDTALLRPGRFDRLVYVGVSEDRSGQMKIIEALTRKFKMAKDVDLKAMVEGCPMGLTGADLYALCSSAWMASAKRTIAMCRGRTQSDEGNDEESFDWSGVEVEVSNEDFKEARSRLVPSVSDEEMKYYKRIQNQFMGTQHATPTQKVT